MSLWEQAYESLKESEPHLIQAYEKILARESGSQGVITHGDRSEKEKEMSLIIKARLNQMDERRWKIRLGSKSVDCRKQVDKVVRFLIIAKDIIQPAGNVDPVHIGLPLVGVCILLQLSVRDSTQRLEFLKGLDYVSYLIPRYAAIEETYLDRQETVLWKEYKAAITRLYGLVLEYEARAACQLVKNTGTQLIRNMVIADDWQTIIERLKTLNQTCEELRQTIDSNDQRTCAIRLDLLLEEHDNKLAQLIRASERKDDLLLKEITSTRQEQREWRLTDDERKCLQALRTSDYEEHKSRNPHRVAGTCQWFLQHPNFKSWVESESSNLLWVSADPGCGKSVLSRYLIEEVVPSCESRTTCYFFFKDDSTEQKTLSNALSALLHQLFSQNRKLLNHARLHFDREGLKLSQLSHTLWAVLTEAASDQEAGSIVCILDALDELEGLGRNELITNLNAFYGSLGAKTSNINFIVSSRPYFGIERQFMELTSHLPTIRLAGEEESVKLSQEIDLVIQDRVRNLGTEIDLSEVLQSSLQNKLRAIPHRTYLWLHLIFDRFDSPSYTEREMEKIIETTPQTVSAAFESILAKVKPEDRVVVKKLLQFVVAAERPLSLEETQIAINLKDTTKSYEDLHLLPLDVFRKRIRHLCGLFISVIDSKVYLIHQTAKDFLLGHEAELPEGSEVCENHICWEHSISQSGAHLSLANACLSYLAFGTFEGSPLSALEKGVFREYFRGKLYRGKKTDKHGNHDDTECEQGFSAQSYLRRHGLLEYAALHWASHFHTVQHMVNARTWEQYLTICDTDSTRFQTWFDILLAHRVKEPTKRPKGCSGLMIASFLGHLAGVHLFIRRDNKVHAVDENGWTPLIWAACGGSTEVAQLLLESGANIEHKDLKGRTALHTAVAHDDDRLVRHLLESGANADSTDLDGTSILITAVRKSCLPIIQELLKRGVDVNAADFSGSTALYHALWRYVAPDRLTLTRRLLERGARTDLMMSSGYTALISAVRTGYQQMAELYIEFSDSIETKDTKGRTLLLIAARYELREGFHYLIEQGADVEAKDKRGQTALALAAKSGGDKFSYPERYESFIAELLKRNANIEAKDNHGRTPLSWASRTGLISIVKCFLEHGADVNSKDREGATALSYAVTFGKPDVAELLVEHGASVESKYAHGMTPLWWADDIVTDEKAEEQELDADGGANPAESS
ncbi:uncharacterized protein KY384_007545 [Bacidia gigantensis]|uniref:uncharacterized protein n=1 Tax=Bacidia gigantensis TaxID=2732470 RepID=UPI001D037C9C|nr:uncharacterized protein KY384_007545 [Bacidia gigantensis]KAG8527393.1 hypothetical protein KY384_007545 [Bacidia gigantensis]